MVDPANSAYIVSLGSSGEVGSNLPPPVTPLLHMIRIISNTQITPLSPRILKTELSRFAIQCGVVQVGASARNDIHEVFPGDR
jgi:hypothetical protein